MWTSVRNRTIHQLAATAHRSADTTHRARAPPHGRRPLARTDRRPAPAAGSDGRRVGPTRYLLTCLGLVDAHFQCHAAASSRPVPDPIDADAGAARLRVRGSQPVLARRPALRGGRRPRALGQARSTRGASSVWAISLQTRSAPCWWLRRSRCFVNGSASPDCTRRAERPAPAGVARNDLFARKPTPASPIGVSPPLHCHVARLQRFSDSLHTVRRDGAS